MTLVASSISGEEVPGRIMVAPWGEVKSSVGMFVVDEESGKKVIDAFKAHGTDIPVDFEHQTLGGSYASPQGTAPAAGWIKSLEAVPGEGLMADVEWTEEAKRMLAAKQYRYLSPVAIIRKRDRRVMSLHSVALTNKPAIVGMSAIVNKAVGENCQVELQALRSVLGIDEGEELELILAAAGERIRVLEKSAVEKEAAELVACARKEGKLADCQSEWALRLALSDRELFEMWVATAPVVVASGRTDGPVGKKGSGVEDRARLEYRGSEVLQAVTSEDAYVADCLRDCG